MKKTYIGVACGTTGKGVLFAANRLAALYGHPPVPYVAFDSDPGQYLSPFLLPGPDGAQVGVSLDGVDLREALRRGGEYPRLRALDRDILKNAKMQAGFGLYSPLGLASATMNQRSVRESIRRLCQATTDIVSSGGGELIVIRVYSTLGGTARGFVLESGEALLDIAETTGAKIRLLDFAVIPGLATSTSDFNSIYLQNTAAHIKETAALRSEAFERILWDERGRPAGDRNRRAMLPNTLVLLSDFATQGSLSQEELATTIARVIQLLSHPDPAFSDAFWGTQADLTRHGSGEPFAARVGLYSRYVPGREASLAQRFRTEGACLERMAAPPDDATALARGFLGRLGLWAPNTDTFRRFGDIKNRIVKQQLGYDPVQRLGGLFAQDPSAYFDEYASLSEAVRGLDVEALAAEIAEEIEKGASLAEQLVHLKASALPGEVVGILRQAIALLEQDRNELMAVVETTGEERTEDEERAATAAQEGHRALSRRNIFGLRRRAVQDALAQVRDHLRAALNAKLHFLSLRVFAGALDKLLADLRGGSLPEWDAAARDAEALTTALLAIRADADSRRALAQAGPWGHRGAATPVPLPTAARQETLAQPDPLPIIEAIRPSLPLLYGASADAVQREVTDRLWPAVCSAVPMVRPPLRAEALSEADLAETMAKAGPLCPVDDTLGHGLRARFVVARGGEASPLKALAARGQAGPTPADRERWVDLGPDFEDELVVMTVEEGVPLRAFKGLAEARDVYRRSTTRHRAHLVPLLDLLPDPLGDEIQEEQIVLLGLTAGAIRREGGEVVYKDPDGINRPVNPALLCQYETVVAITSKFIAHVDRRGFAPVLREMEGALSGSPSPAIRALFEQLRQLAALYNEPIRETRPAEA